jgi:hypothetical protein
VAVADFTGVAEASTVEVSMAADFGVADSGAAASAPRDLELVWVSVWPAPMATPTVTVTATPTVTGTAIHTDMEATLTTMEDAIWSGDEYGRHTVGGCVGSRCVAIENRI